MSALKEVQPRLTTQKEFYLSLPPDPGGINKAKFNVDDTIIFDPSIDRILAPERPLRVLLSPTTPDSPLEEAGFSVKKAMANLVSEINRGIDQGQSLQEALSGALQEPMRNIRHHANEYTKERPLLVGEVKRNDRVRNIYNNEPVTNHLDWSEREGATAIGSLALEEEVLKAEEGQSVVLLSPAGWNGIYTDYEKAQFVYFRVKNAKSGELEQLTFVLNYKYKDSVRDCVDLLAEMGVSSADLVCSTQRDTIKRIASHPILVGPESGVSSSADFLNLIRRKRPMDPVVDVIERDLDRLSKGEDISILSDECEGYIQELHDFILENAEKIYNFSFQDEISNRIEETIYKIASFTRGWGLVPQVGVAAEGMVSVPEQNSYSSSWREKYQLIIEELKQISGCAGGGTSSVAILSGFNVAKEMETVFDKDDNGSLEFKCPKCKRKNTRLYGQRNKKNCGYSDCGASIGC